MADPYGNYQVNQGLLSGPGLNPKGLDPELLRQITGLLSQTGPTPGLAFPAGHMGYEVLQDAATAGKYAMGNPDRLTTDQIIPSVVNSAMALGAVGMPMAEAGSAGLFGGRLAANAEKQSGWFRSPVDNLERFEIPDQNSRFLGLKKAQVNTLGDVLDHPDLYAAYPDLKEMQVYYNSNMSLGQKASFHPVDKVIELNPELTPAEAHSSLLHEIQHAIQQREGFAGGSSPSIEASRLRQLQGEVNRAQDVQGDPAIIDRLKGMESTLADVNPYDQYRKVAGEAEARNVQARQNYGILARQAWPPWVTQDVPWVSQLRR
jgi:hypothetical protein